MFLKQCNTEEANSSVAGCDETTFRNWVWYILSVISTVEIVSINNFIIGDKLIFLKIDFDNRHMRSNGNICLVSVDGTDFCIMEPWPFSTKWWSHKFNGPGLRYEIVVCMQTGWIVMVNGPHPCGDWSDLCIAVMICTQCQLSLRAPRSVRTHLHSSSPSEHVRYLCFLLV